MNIEYKKWQKSNREVGIILKSRFTHIIKSNGNNKQLCCFHTCRLFVLILIWSHHFSIRLTSPYFPFLPLIWYQLSVPYELCESNFCMSLKKSGKVSNTLYVKSTQTGLVEISNFVILTDKIKKYIRENFNAERKLWLACREINNNNNNNNKTIHGLHPESVVSMVR